MNLTKDEFFALRDLAHSSIVELARSADSIDKIRLLDRVLRYLVEFAVACKSCTRPRSFDKSYEYFRKKILALVDEFDKMDEEGVGFGEDTQILFGKLIAMENEV